jgi:hypothetical protein
MRSSVIASHSYDPATAELTVTFATGRVYLYRGVPEELAAAFEIALSKGVFFKTRIRDHFRCRELDPESRRALW